MKTAILTIALATALTGATAVAQDYRYDHRSVAYYSSSRDSLDRHIDHLNRMLNHVRWEVRRYHADWRIRREVDQISREVDRVNYRFRHGSIRRWGLRHEVDRLHDRLHGIEQRLRVRSRDYYRWD